ncbi:OLC1v1019584C1 [Oldenlandia corymbosa var. corymbosa]|uniref:OLC1v1019584C1 n=1 Tax=Oldenlandia corymbosa var. corymbosa TaxID=529605 RepID=A0AAV1EEF9_OLDCO|nr:OLC1v1019584C1 [Oldenlandia corymbosa var. corymbosa]
MLLHLGQKPTMFISSADAAEEALTKHDSYFVDRPKSTFIGRLTYNFKDMTFSPYGEYWRQARFIAVSHLLSKKKVQSFRSVREEEIARMMKNLRESCVSGAIVCLSEAFATLTNDIISLVAIGKRVAIEIDEYLDSIFEKALKSQEMINLSIGNKLHRNLLDILLGLQREKTTDIDLDLDLDSIKAIILSVGIRDFGKKRKNFGPFLNSTVDLKKGQFVDFNNEQFAFSPFGYGRRTCPGSGFALVIAELTIANLIRNFDFALPNGGKPEELDMTEVFGMMMPRKIPLLVNVSLPN